ncbi:MAG: STAS domain-containing protein [Candidatus Acidiferrum sp.]
MFAISSGAAAGHRVWEFGFAVAGLAGARELLSQISGSRAQKGFTPSETALFVLSVKKPLFAVLRERQGSDPDALAAELWTTTEIIDGLGLYTTDVYLKTRTDIIHRQQEEMLELSTPVVKLWEGILALPIIGTLDSARTQVAMENLLEGIVKTNSRVAIIDLPAYPQWIRWWRNTC